MSELNSDIFSRLSVNRFEVNYVVNFSFDFKYIYVETPKVACATIKRLLQVAEVKGDMSRLPDDVHDRSGSPIPEIRTGPVKFQKLLADPGTFTFCFVRNPFSRALSCYLDKFFQNFGEKQRLSKKLGLDANRDVSFADFLLAVKDQPVAQMDIHWMPQSILLQPLKMRYCYIGRFESLDADLDRVARRLGFPDVERRRISPNATAARDRVKEHFGPRETKLVQDIYAGDFESFGYGWSHDVV